MTGFTQKKVVGKPLDSWMTQRQLADRLDISQRSLERMRTDGTGPRFAKAGRRVLYNVVEVEAWLANQSFENTAEAKQGRRE